MSGQRHRPAGFWPAGWVAVLGALWLGCPRNSGGPPPSELATALRSHVETLASDTMAGRLPGSPGEAAAASYVARRFEAHHLRPVGSAGYLQPFNYVFEGVTVRSAGNVLGLLDRGAARTVVVGAHYDHLGAGRWFTRELAGSRGIHHGANDNASGVAVLLELVAHFEAHPPPVNILFACWSAEEFGLEGSRHFVARPGALTGVLAYVNLEMVGGLHRTVPLLAVEGGVEVPAWLPLLERLPHPAFSLRTADPITPGSTDHVSFHGAGIPSVSFSTGETATYHRSTDLPGSVNVDGMVAIHAFTAALVEALAANPAALGRAP